MNVPETLRYTENHEWVKVDGKVATIGITDYAQGELGDIVYVDITAVGQKVGKDEVFGSIEAVKTVSDLFAPVGGEVTTVNPDLEDSPEKVNSSPYEEGWIVKMEIDDAAEIDGLLTAEDYLKKIAG